MYLVPFTDLQHLGPVIRAFDLTIDIPEERFGVSWGIEDQHARRILGKSLEAVDYPSRRIKELARLHDLFFSGHGELYLALEHVVGLVPRMIMWRRPLVLRDHHLHERPRVVGFSCCA